MSRGAGQRGLDRHGNYAAGTQIGVEGYGVTPVRTKPAFNVAVDLPHMLAKVTAEAQRLYIAMGLPYIGARATAWGSELVVFDRLVGAQRWAAEQAADRSVWYAAAFDLSASPSPFAEVVR